MESKKSIEELLKEFFRLIKEGDIQPRKLVGNSSGTILLDLSNPEDVEWYENDDDYDVI